MRTSRKPAAKPARSRVKHRAVMAVKARSNRSVDEIVEPRAVLPALRDVHLRLIQLRSVVLTSVLALKNQRAEHDPEIAETLKRCVADEMDKLIWSLKGIFGGEPHPHEKSEES